MQNSPSSSDSAYSTGSENGFSANQTGNQIQLLPLRLPEKRSRVETDFYDENSGAKFQIMDQDFNNMQSETLYDTEITYTESYSTSRTTPSTRVPKFHSHHELISRNSENSSNHWLGMLQNNDVQFSPNQNAAPVMNPITDSTPSLKPEDFLTQIDQVDQNSQPIKIEKNLLNNADTTFENIPSPKQNSEHNFASGTTNTDFNNLNQTFLQKPVPFVDDFIFGQF